MFVKRFVASDLCDNGKATVWINVGGVLGVSVMKTLIIAVTVLGLKVSAHALDKAKLDYRINKLAAKFEAMQQNSEKRIPANMLDKAQSIILLDRTKAGLIFAFQGGSGMALVKDQVNKEWSAPAFLSANEASLGFQIGGEQNFFVILLMNTNAAARLFTDSTFELGGEARGTIGDDSAGEEGSIGSPEVPIVVYAERRGLYGGAAIKGGSLSPDEKANRIYYGRFLTATEILFDRKGTPSEAAVRLAQKINEYSRTTEISHQ